MVRIPPPLPFFVLYTSLQDTFDVVNMDLRFLSEDLPITDLFKIENVNANRFLFLVN